MPERFYWKKKTLIANFQERKKKHRKDKAQHGPVLHQESGQHTLRLLAAADTPTSTSIADQARALLYSRPQRQDKLVQIKSDRTRLLHVQINWDFPVVKAKYNICDTNGDHHYESGGPETSVQNVWDAIHLEFVFKLSAPFTSGSGRDTAPDRIS